MVPERGGWRPARWRIGISRCFLAATVLFLGISVGCAPSQGWELPADQPGCVQLCLVYAPWCAACRYAKPAVLRISTERGTQVSLRLLLQASPEGQAFSARYAVRCVPAVLLLDRQGRPLTSVVCGLTAQTEIDSLVQKALRQVGCP